MNFKAEMKCDLCGGWAYGLNECKCIECEYIGIINRAICNDCYKKKEHKR